MLVFGNLSKPKIVAPPLVLLSSVRGYGSLEAHRAVRTAV
jgi:hypothetical protein